MKLAIVLTTAALLALSIPAPAQQFRMATASALVLPAHDQFIQYSFPFTPNPDDRWIPGQRTKKTPCLQGMCPGKTARANWVDVETDYSGISRLWLSDSHDFCGPKFQPQGYCSYQGTFYMGPYGTPILMPDGSAANSVFGLVNGVFVDDSGHSYNAPAIFNFTTYPNPSGGSIPATGSVIVELWAK